MQPSDILGYKVEQIKVDKSKLETWKRSMNFQGSHWKHKDYSKQKQRHDSTIKSLELTSVQRYREGF